MNNSEKILCYDNDGNAHIVNKADLVHRQSVYGLSIKEGGALLVDSKNRKTKQWELPGGGIDEGETIIEALKREFKEETGLEIINNPKKICDFTEYYYDINSQKGWESTRHFYEVETSGDINIDGKDFDVTEARYIKDYSFADIVPVTRKIISMAIG